MEAYQLECPNCGCKIYIYVRPDGSIAVRSFHIEDQAEIIKIAENMNLEFGVNYFRKEDEDGAGKTLSI